MPVFGSQCLGIGIAVFLIVLELYTGVMLEYVLIALNTSENIGILLDDGVVRYNINHTFHTVLNGMMQRKCERTGRFAAAGRNRKRVNARDWLRRKRTPARSADAACSARKSGCPIYLAWPVSG